jgi:hypothetical protein
LDQKRWITRMKETMRAINDAAEVFTEIRDTVESWGMTRRQADKWCMAYFQAALEQKQSEERLE